MDDAEYVRLRRASTTAVQAMALRRRLDDLEAKIRALTPHAVPEPGLSDDEFDELWSVMPFEAPYELRVWHQWHDRFVDAPWGHYEDTLEQQIKSWQLLEYIGLSTENKYGDPPIIPFTKSFLMLYHNQAGMVMDCSHGADQAAPLYYLWVQEEFDPQPAAASLAHLVEMWHLCADLGLWVPYPEPQPHPSGRPRVWRDNRHLLPPEFAYLSVPVVPYA